jgi:hypothetical protein
MVGGLSLSYTLPGFDAVKILVILFLVFIVASLGSALYFLITDRGGSERMVKALTVRVVLSVVLFALLMLGFYFGLITGRIQ